MMRRNERAAVTVEFAFVAPLLLLFLIGAVQVALVVIGNTVGSNAAREGSRTATIRYECADNHVSARCPVTPSTNYGVVKAAVMARLAGLVKPSSVNVTVQCRKGSATGIVVLCERGTVKPDNDVVVVAVTWDHVGITAWAPGTTHSSTSRMVILGRPDLASLVPEPDGFPPALAGPIVASDPGADGVLDKVTMTFDEDIVQSASASAFTVANSPTGSNSITSVVVSGRVVTLTLAGSTVNTAPGAMTVALTASPSGVVDLHGNRGSFDPTAVADGAGPVLLAITDTGGAVNGRMGALDSLTLSFSEPIATSLGSTSVVQSDPMGGGNDSVSISGITAGPQLTNSNDYQTSNDSSLSVGASISKSGNNVTVAILSPMACTPSACTGLGTGVDSAPFSITPATSLVDAAGKAARGSRTISNIF
ncbi:MAG TPA: TadE/TadG family type IV pilus assembly protein [Acidimicrobiales bacterium]|nr:TadE/TadG family type IV pilus assembly protein [Acidimicrobiales bacterium]